MKGTRITVIPARPSFSRQTGIEAVPKLRVAAYCRVSTDSDEQATSYETQIEHYTDYIQQKPNWELAGIYADDGISGTNTKKREEFNRMINDCMASKIDMIITKSISRFARNTLDCLKYIRQLKEKNIPVFFEKEAINTMDAKGEVLLTIMASLAQQESQSLSQNVKLGLQYRYQQGIVQINHNRFMGYTKDENGKLCILPKEAKIVKRIYREYLEGQSLIQIGRGLEKNGILTGAGKPKWRAESVRKILTNEKYIGDALLQKTYTVDFLTKKRVKNKGIVPQYYVENSHPAIIPRDIYMLVQEEMARRTNIFSGTNMKKRVYSSRYALSSAVICAHCGDIFRRIVWDIHGKKSVVWRCVSRLEKGSIKCTARTVKERLLQRVVVRAVNKLMANSDKFIGILQANVEAVLGKDKVELVADIDEKLVKLQKAMLEVANANEDYEPLAHEIDRLKEKKQKALAVDANQVQVRHRVQDLKDFLQGDATQITEYDEQLVRRLIKKIIVFDDKFVVEFKAAGLEVEIKL